MARPEVPRPHAAIVPNTFVRVHIGTAQSRARARGREQRRDECRGLRQSCGRTRGNVPLSVEFSHRALRYLPEDDADLGAVIALNLGNAHMISGGLAAAEEAFGEASTASQKAGNVYVALAAKRGLAQLETMRGRLRRSGRFAASDGGCSVAGPYPA